MAVTSKSNGEVAPIGFCNFRNQRTKFGIKLDDRRRHIYVIGKTGVGKTTLLENMVISDLQSGRGVGVVDPHGEFAERMLDFVPEERVEDVVYFNPADTDYPIAFNPMERVSAEHRHLVASGLMGVFKKIWPDVWSARMEYILNNTLLALLEFPSSTVLGIMRMLAEPPYRKKVIENLQDPVIKAFWVNEFSRYSQRLESEAVAAIQNKVGQFVSNPLVRNIMGQPHSTLNMRKIMDDGKIFIANLSKGKIGEDNSALLGSMLITRLNLAAMSRVDIPERDRKDYFLYVDEFQNFATDSFANILSEARKYRLSLTLSHQYIGQLIHEQNTRVRDAVFGNVGTIVCFRVGAADAEFLEKEFLPEFTEQDLVNLAKANIYIKLMIDGVASRPFSSETIPPPKPPLVSHKDEIVKMSREKYGTPRAVVDKKIAGEWQGDGEMVVEEKVIRRGERSPGDLLRGREHVQGFSKRFDGAPREQRFDGYPRERRDFPPAVSRSNPPRERQGYEERPWQDRGTESRPWPGRERDRGGFRPQEDRLGLPPIPRERFDGAPAQGARLSPRFGEAGAPEERHRERPRQPLPRSPRWSSSEAGHSDINREGGPHISHKPDVNVEDLRKAISASLQKSVSRPDDNSEQDERPRITPPPIRRNDEDVHEKPFYVTEEDVGEGAGPPVVSPIEPPVVNEVEPETTSLEELAEAEERGQEIGQDEQD